MQASPYILLLLAILVGVAGQLLLKLGMVRQPEFRFVDIIGALRNWPVVVGFSCYGVSTLLYLQVLAGLELSLAYPTVSLGYVLVIVMSRLLFKEVITRMRWIAVGVICVGVLLVGLA